ncbi:hypothetical protein [Micromonospora sp. NPDC049891]|uniref:hypothetical protein n=1 Tax=Micromonospora sp. NPDC049891 TaxID=3155655 RepID=UPI0033E906FB
MIEGVCHGGPMHGLTVVSRGQCGLLVADKPSGQCWLYAWRDGAFHFHERRVLDMVRAVDAAMGEDWDVVALPGGVVADGDR